MHVQPRDVSALPTTQPPKTWQSLPVKVPIIAIVEFRQTLTAC